MGSASALALSFGVVAFCAAILNAQVYALRRQEPAHMWLAISSLASVVFSILTALLYQSTSPEESEYYQRLMLVASGPLALSFYRFSFCLLKIERPKLDRTVLVFCFCVVAISLVPGAVYSHEYKMMRIDMLGITYPSYQLNGLGLAITGVYAALFVHLIHLYTYYSSKITEKRTSLVFALGFWLTTAINDVCVGFEIYQAPLLLGIGYTGFVLCFSGILTSRMVDSMNEVERHALSLEELVEKRTAALREKELQLAHGARVSVLGTLAAGVAHEINNPVAFVSANLNLLGEIWNKPSENDDVPEILQECKEGVTRIGSIVAALLSMARRSDGTDCEVDLTQVVESTLPILSRESSYLAELHTELQPVPTLQGDPQLLGQVAVNLLVNAFQSFPDESDPENRVDVATWADEEWVYLEVQDTGPGIPDEVRKRVFDPFFTTKDSRQSTGLGLAITHQIVERHRGKIEIESSPAGTTIRVAFPLDAEEVNP